MSRLFISHSSTNDHEALALSEWLKQEGWAGEQDIYLDIHPDDGISAGERWLHSFEQANLRCEAVLFLVSEAWLSSDWCQDEFKLASSKNKKLFVLLLQDLPLDRLPKRLVAQWQVIKLFASPHQHFTILHPLTQVQKAFFFSIHGLSQLRSGLRKAGIGPDTFDLVADPDGPYGWRNVYRGLVPLEEQDAAVFFGREADIDLALNALHAIASAPRGKIFVILGASGSGKSSFLRAGLLARMRRDDSMWLVLRALRVAGSRPLQGGEGFFAAVREAFAVRGSSRSIAELREALESDDAFERLLCELVESAQRQILFDDTKPLPVFAIDQAEELLSSDAAGDVYLLAHRLQAAIQRGSCLVMLSIATDRYDAFQAAAPWSGLRHETFSLTPVSVNEWGRIMREPALVLRKKIGPEAPVLSEPLMQNLQLHFQDDPDGLPLLAFVLQRLIEEYRGMQDEHGRGLIDLPQNSGEASVPWILSQAISEAGAESLDLSGAPPDAETRSSLVRDVFIPGLARVVSATAPAQRRVARLDEFTDPSAAKFVEALIAKRLLTRKRDGSDATVEVSHEAVLRRWPLLASLVEADCENLLLLENVLRAASDWSTAAPQQKADLLVHKSDRLESAQSLLRQPRWRKVAAGAQEYLSAAKSAEVVQRHAQQVVLWRNRGILVLIVLAVASYWYWTYIEAQLSEARREVAESNTRAAEQRAADAANAARAAIDGTVDTLIRVFNKAGTVPFNYAVIRNENELSGRLLKEVATGLLEIDRREQKRDLQITIEGHVGDWCVDPLDEERLASPELPASKCGRAHSREYSLGLGERMGSAARNFLIELGFESEQISLISFGEERPRVSPQEETSRWTAKERNRLAEQNNRFELSYRWIDTAKKGPSSH